MAAVATATTTPADPRRPRTAALRSAAALAVVVGVPAAQILLLPRNLARPSRLTWTRRLAAVVTDDRTCCPEDLAAVVVQTCNSPAATSATTEVAAVAANAASVARAAIGRPVRASRRRVVAVERMIPTSVEAARRRRPWRMSLDRRYRTSRRGRAGEVEEVLAALAAAAMTGRAAAAAAAIIATAGGACVVVIAVVDGEVAVPSTMSAACLAALVLDRTAEDRQMAKAAAVDAACATDRAMVVVVVGTGSRVSCASRGRVVVAVARRGSRGSRGIGRGIGVVGMLMVVVVVVGMRVV